MIVSHIPSPDPEWEERFNRARAMGEADAKAGRDPQSLTGELAGFQHEYDDAFTEAQLELPTN